MVAGGVEWLQEVFNGCRRCWMVSGSFELMQLGVRGI